MAESVQSTAIPVFISYSHDSTEHGARVLALSDRLRSEGLDCIIDQYDESPTKGWPAWMRDQIARARFVLLVCTETYERRFLGQEIPGTGRGVIWEGAVISQEIYDGSTNNEKFIPIIMSSSDSQHIPHPLRGVQRYDVSDEQQYEKLYRRLTGQPVTPMPALGKLKSLPPRERITSFTIPPSTEEPMNSNNNDDAAWYSGFDVYKGGDRAYRGKLMGTRQKLLEDIRGTLHEFYMQSKKHSQLPARVGYPQLPHFAERTIQKILDKLDSAISQANLPCVYEWAVLETYFLSELYNVTLDHFVCDYSFYAAATLTALEVLVGDCGLDQDTVPQILIVTTQLPDELAFGQGMKDQEEWDDANRMYKTLFARVIRDSYSIIVERHTFGRPPGVTRKLRKEIRSVLQPLPTGRCCEPRERDEFINWIKENHSFKVRQLSVMDPERLAFVQLVGNYLENNSTNRWEPGRMCKDLIVFGKTRVIPDNLSRVDHIKDAQIQRTEWLFGLGWYDVGRHSEGQFVKSFSKPIYDVDLLGYRYSIQDLINVLRGEAALAGSRNPLGLTKSDLISETDPWKNLWRESGREKRAERSGRKDVAPGKADGPAAESRVALSRSPLPDDVDEGHLKEELVALFKANMDPFRHALHVSDFDYPEHIAPEDRIYRFVDGMRGEDTKKLLDVFQRLSEAKRASAILKRVLEHLRGV